MTDRRLAQDLWYKLHVENITVVFTRHSSISAAFFTWKVLTCSQTVPKCGMQGTEGKIQSRESSAMLTAWIPQLIKNAGIANPETQEGKGQVCHPESEYFNWDIVAAVSVLHLPSLAVSVTVCPAAERWLGSKQGQPVCKKTLAPCAPHACFSIHP